MVSCMLTRAFVSKRRGLLRRLLAVDTRELGGAKLGEAGRLPLAHESASSSGSDTWPTLTGDERPLLPPLLRESLPLSPLPGRAKRGDVVLLSAASMNFRRLRSGW